MLSNPLAIHGVSRAGAGFLAFISWSLTMFKPDCPEFRVLARLHLEKYNVRLKLLDKDAFKEDPYMRGN
jgi:hypothetical protein